MIDQIFRISVVLAMLWNATSTIAAETESSQPCPAKYGDIIVFDQCNPVRLPGVEVKFVGISQPNKATPVSCWNYEASVSGSEKTLFQHCHTGALGGQTHFNIAGKPFTVLFDLSKGCKRFPAGSWAPEMRGHAFYAGILDANTLDDITLKQSQSEQDCFARKGN